MSDDDEQHCDEAFRVEEGDDVVFVMDDGSEVRAEVVDKSSYNDESGPHITEQTIVRLEQQTEDTSLIMGRTDGLSGIPDADPFPSFFPLHETHPDQSGGEIPDERILGYVTEVHHADAEDGNGE